MNHGFALPARSSARGSSSSANRLCMVPCESFTQKRAAPFDAAPSIAALTYLVIHVRARSYSTPLIMTWLYAATPPMPSMSTEIQTLAGSRLGTVSDGSEDSCLCADGGTRTRTPLREPPPEDGA